MRLCPVDDFISAMWCRTRLTLVEDIPPVIVPLFVGTITSAPMPVMIKVRIDPRMSLVKIKPLQIVEVLDIRWHFVSGVGMLSVSMTMAVTVVVATTFTICVFEVAMAAFP